MNESAPLQPYELELLNGYSPVPIDGHPSFIRLSNTSPTSRSFALGMEAADSANNGATLQPGTFTLVPGGIGAGKTKALVGVAFDVANICHQRGNGVVAVALAGPEAPSFLGKLKARLLDDEIVANRIRITHIRSASELVLFVAQLIAAGEQPAAVLVDDIGLLDEPGAHARARIAARVLHLIAEGDLGRAFAYASGLDLPLVAAKERPEQTTPMPVLATALVRGETRPGGWNDSVFAQDATTIVSTEGKLLKSRTA